MESGEGNCNPLQYSCWKIPWTEEPGGLQSIGSLRVGHNWATSLSLSCIGEGNGNPLQYSCLENPGTGEPGGLPSMRSHRVGHDWSDLAAAAVIGSNGQTQILADYIWPKDTKIHKSYISVNFSPKVFPWGRYKDKAHQQSKSACYCIMKGMWLSSKVNIVLCTGNSDNLDWILRTKRSCLSFPLSI